MEETKQSASVADRVVSVHCAYVTRDDRQYQCSQGNARACPDLQPTMLSTLLGRPTVLTVGSSVHVLG